MSVELKPGKYELIIKKEGYEEEKTEIQLEDGEEATSLTSRSTTADPSLKPF
ncbi:PEGA domain-containing protein [Pyrococcus yayanosii]|uniref:PEGA domain-containing protein n=1 Tax=Pyrococcus yayanosii (strain CH1 / JCM 16557) TaxID=529709 RepID=F8AEJ4_PYRYC|nr:PEGA domain-containing protein [Pyrococcus yayanosii]AEH24673.1 hypothetical protein PYCH_09880 [Pyrococcus yayanosii CH1]